MQKWKIIFLNTQVTSEEDCWAILKFVLSSLFRQQVRQLYTNAKFYLLSEQILPICWKEEIKWAAFPNYWTLNSFADLKSDESATCASSTYTGSTCTIQHLTLHSLPQATHLMLI